MSAPSLVYRSAVGYEIVMRLLYGRHFGARLTAVAGQVPDGCDVLECCCGPGTLYLRHLRGRVRSYVGLDVSERFVARLQRSGVDARRADLRDATVALPLADVAILQASLYHFLPDAEGMLDRMLAAARDRVIVAEPVRNLSDSHLAPVAALARLVTDPGTGGHEQRFDDAALDRLMARYASRIRAEFTIPGGREKVFVLQAGGGSGAPG